MTRPLFYMCHPVAPTSDETAAAAAARNLTPFGDEIAVSPRTEATYENVKRAMRWHNWLRRRLPGATIIAPWIASIIAGADDADAAQRRHGLDDALNTIDRCDGCILVGGRNSSGMYTETSYGVTASRIVRERGPGAFEVFDLTALGPEPPDGEHAFPTELERYLGPSVV